MTQKPNDTLQIERTDSYKVGDRFFGTLEGAKDAALRSLLPTELGQAQQDLTCNALMERASDVIEILAWGENNSKPKRKPRSDIGRAHKKPAADAAPEGVGVKVEGSGKYANK